MNGVILPASRGGHAAITLYGGKRVFRDSRRMVGMVFFACYLADGVLHTHLCMHPGLEQSLSTLQQGFGFVLGTGERGFTLSIVQAFG